MGLHPVLGRLINSGDDGPKAAPVAVLTHRFWTTVLHSDPAVVGKVIRLGPGNATVVGVLIEVPVMLSVCAFCNRTRDWFPAPSPAAAK